MLCPMTDLRRPLLVLHVVWHPASGHDRVAEAIRAHFGRDRFATMTGRMGMSVAFRSVGTADGALPAPVDLTASDINVVVVLAGDEMANGNGWPRYVAGTVDAARSDGLRHRVFPVTVSRTGLEVAGDLQAIRWDTWDGDDEERRSRLVFELTLEVSVMLEGYHRHLRDHDVQYSADTLPDPLRIFLSHSKHDDTGEASAKAVRDWLHRNSRLSSFLDIVNMPPGHSFEEVLAAQVRRSAVIVLYSDTFSAREWCRREVLLAKQSDVPMVVAVCLQSGDERGFPYLGNVPIMPLGDGGERATQALIGRLFDEVLKHALWRCRTAPLHQTHAQILFTPRPPELLMIAQLRRADAPPALIVYADPPLGVDEERLFEGSMPPVKSLGEWLVGEVI